VAGVDAHAAPTTSMVMGASERRSNRVIVTPKR
jgi:hypothetical protein